MNTIIAGSRGITDAGRLNRAIRESGFDITTVVSGMCSGSPDMMGVAWAKRQDPKIGVLPMPADWTGLGKRAGMVRNCQMAKEADALIALWDGKSSGTRHMIDEAVGKGLYHHIDAACGKCGALLEVAIYRYSDGTVTNETRAICKACAGRGPTTAFFDIFKVWGKKTLHVTEPRMKQEIRTVPVVEFGTKGKIVKGVRKVRPLPPTPNQGSLFGG